MKKQLLGSFKISYDSFQDLEAVFEEFLEPQFQHLSERKKFKRINKALLDLIQKAPEPCFLLGAVCEFIEKVNTHNLLSEKYHFLNFEFWLNHFSRLSFQDNVKIRAKIVGKCIPRDEYQALFPIGMGKVFSGTHFVAAHLSPDIDTTISSFWGWIDAFGARVSEGVHQWSLPGIIQDTHTKLLFQNMFSKSFFENTARQVATLTLTGLDLVTKKDVVKISNTSLVTYLDHAMMKKPVLVVDEFGHFQGDWRSSDAEATRQVVVLFGMCLRYFQSAIHQSLVQSFAKRDVQFKDILKDIDVIFQTPIKNSPPAQEFSDKQKRYLTDYIKKVLTISHGPSATFFEIFETLDPLTEGAFENLQKSFQALFTPDLFDSDGKLIGTREKIFVHLEKIFKKLDDTMHVMRSYFDRLDVLLDIKHKVFESIPHFVTLKSDVDEIRSKIGTYNHLAVVVPDVDGKWFPVGVIYAQDLKKQILGTLSMRDFSNEHETKMASYLEVISIVDHHKTDIKTTSAPTMLIADTQSSNTLVGQVALDINKRYSTLGTTKEEIEKEIKNINVFSTDEHEIKKLQILLQLKLNLDSKNKYYVHPKREYFEYVSFLTGILDDTDLLTKVSSRDVLVVRDLLNRMKSLCLGKNVTTISLDDIPQDENFAKAASRKILQNEDMHSIYKTIYEFKEQEVEQNIKLAIEKKPSNIFADTKEQNGCCRVGQTKIFRVNFPFFEQYAHEIRKIWFEEAESVFEKSPNIDLHIHMVSTVSSADEVHSETSIEYQHSDELWLWCSSKQRGQEHLISFLNNFQGTEVVKTNAMHAEFLGENANDLELLFEQNFPKASRKKTKKEHLPIVVLRFKAGLLNSRKAQITPCLPRDIP